MNVVFSCSSIDYLSGDIVTRKLGLGIFEIHLIFL